MEENYRNISSIFASNSEASVSIGFYVCMLYSLNIIMYLLQLFVNNNLFHDLTGVLLRLIKFLVKVS